MKIPKKLHKPAFISIGIVLVLSITLIIVFGFERAREIFGFISNFISLPAAIISLCGISYLTINEEKLINRRLIEAGKNDQKEWEEERSKMSARK